jgi:hypothetical protein
VTSKEISGAFITGPIAGAGGVTLALRIFDRRA